MERSGSVASDSNLGGQSEADIWLESRLSGLIREVGRLFTAGDSTGALQHLEEVKHLHRDDGGIERLVALLRQVLKLDKAHRSLDVAAFLEAGDGPSTSVGSAPTAADFASWVQVLSTQFCKLLDVPTAWPGFVERVGSEAASYIEVLGHFVAVHQAARFPTCERFLAPAAVIRRLRTVQSEASAKAQASSLLAAPLERLAIEAELLRCLLAADYKTSLLKGVDAFAQLTRAEEILAQFANVPKQLTATCGTASGSTARGSMRSSAGGQGQGARKAGTSTSVDLDQSHGRWYAWLYSHCMGRLLLFCGAGLTAAAALGPKQVGPPRAADAQAIPGSISVALPGQRSRGGMTGLLSSEISPSPYLEDLRRLAALPSVACVGIFANARQLPHLQDWHRSLATPGKSPGDSMVAPYQDAAWLLMPPEPGELSSGVPDAECEWWALTFAAARQERSAQDNATSKHEHSAVSSGAEAIEAFRFRCHEEWRRLRTALSQACAERHVPRCGTPPSPLSGCRTPLGLAPRMRVGSTGSPSTSGLRSRKRSETASSVGDFRYSFRDLPSFSPLQLPAAAFTPASLTSTPTPPPGNVLGAPVEDSLSATPESLLAHTVDLPEAPYTTRHESGSAPRHSAARLSTALTNGGSVGSSGAAGSAGLGQGGRAGSGTEVDASPFRCLVMPLDIGMFPSPLFLGLVEKDLPMTSGSASPFVESVVTSRCMLGRPYDLYAGPRPASDQGITSAVATGTAVSGAAQALSRRGGGDLAISRSSSGHAVRPRELLVDALERGEGQQWWQPLKRWCAKVLKIDEGAAAAIEDGRSAIERELMALAAAISGRRLRACPSVLSATSRRDSLATVQSQPV